MSQDISSLWFKIVFSLLYSSSRYFLSGKALNTQWHCDLPSLSLAKQSQIKSSAGTREILCSRQSFYPLSKSGTTKLSFQQK